MNDKEKKLKNKYDFKFLFLCVVFVYSWSGGLQVCLFRQLLNVGLMWTTNLAAANQSMVEDVLIFLDC